MKHHTDTDASNLEAEYIRMKVTLYKNFFRYCTIVVLIVIIKEAFRAILYSKFGSMVMICVVLIFGGSSIYFIGRQKENQELSITICLTLLFLCGLMTQYHSNSGYFDVPLETFNVAYAYAAFERIVLSRISKFSHRACFLLCTTSVRAFTIRTSSIALLIMQFVYMSFTIYLDYDREKYDKRFFTTYFKNKEQLLKFKNLVVQDIPESIIIISQNLTKPLFVNNSFEQLIEDNTNKSLHARLKEFLIHDSLDVSRASSQGSSASLPARKQTLLRFLESTVLQVNRSPENQKFSCNLIYKKNLSEDEEGEDERNQEYMFEAKVVHLLWDEEPAIAVILHDITQQHTILSLKIADAHKDTILATVSHELRTPLNGIMGMVQIIQKKVKDTEILNYLKICKNSGDLLLSLVNSILDLNQIRAKKLKLSLETVKLSELLENIIRLFEFQCQHKGLNLKLKMTPNCPEYITTDKNRLSQIFINLVGNALKFTQSGGIIISVSEAYNSEELAFMVEDTGAGIKDDDKKKLFKVFGKLEQSDNTVNPHGVGLGLTISDKLARLLGSDGIDLESEYGKGSRFIFVIKKNLKNINEPGDQEIDTQRQISDEQGDVHNKMLNYSREYVKTSQPTFPDHSMRTLIDISNSTTRKSSLSFTAKIRSLESNPNQIKKDSNSGVTPCTLIVDDNPLNAIIAETLVNSHGYKAKTALYGQVAIDIILNTNFTTEPIKLVFMDCQMPVMDGFTVTKILKKMMLEKKIPEIPIVALTANDSGADREASKRAGMCEHMTKPLKESELGRILNKYMTK